MTVTRWMFPVQGQCIFESGRAVQHLLTELRKGCVPDGREVSLLAGCMRVNTSRQFDFEMCPRDFFLPFADPSDRLDQMNKYLPIEQVVDSLKNDFDWNHSFIRECYFASKHCMVEFLDDSGERVVGDTDGPLYTRIVISICVRSEHWAFSVFFRPTSGT